MITATQLLELTTIAPSALTRLVNGKSKTTKNFVACRFLGLTNAQEFCYTATYLVEQKECTTKVFITRDPSGQLKATI
jgi:hypothetical protein